MNLPLKSEATAAELVEIGDDFARRGDNARALQAFQAAYSKAPPAMRASVWGRCQIARYEPPTHNALIPIQQAIEAAFPGADAFVSTNLAVWGKTNSFMSDGRLLSLTWKHQALLPAPNWEWNFQAALWAVAQTRDLVGDYVELGVFKGHTTILLAEYFDFQQWDRRWFLYDTFDGIPADQLNPGWAAANEEVYRGTYTFEEVRERFSAFPNIEVIKGRVPEILREQCPDQIAFLHMDMNSAIAEIAALEFVFDRIVPGGIILFDDYCWLTAQAQHTAEKAWFRDRGLSILEMPTGQGVFVKR